MSLPANSLRSYEDWVRLIHRQMLDHVDLGKSAGIPPEVLRQALGELALRLCKHEQLPFEEMIREWIIERLQLS